MHELLDHVPRLQALGVFECAARLGSFTAAAHELAMTQSGVSRQVSRLETQLGLTLFDRRANEVTLNSNGRVLQEAIGHGFSTISQSIDQLIGDDSTFLLAANPGFAQRWLVPHLTGLAGALAEADLRLMLFDRDTELGDDFDAAVHLTVPSALPEGSVWLFEEAVVPVAAPEYAQRHGLDPTTTPQRLLEADLLHLDGRDRQWVGWPDWFAHAGLDWSIGRARLTYNNHALVMEDAVSGSGVALGWRGLVDSALDSGVLVPVGPEVVRPDMGYHLIPGRRGVSEAFLAVADWLTTLPGWFSAAPRRH